MKFRKLAPIAVGALTVLIAASACAGGSDKANAPAPVAKPPAAAADSVNKPQVLAVAQVKGFSPFVVNGKGRTIYRFDKDSNNPPTTDCDGACAQTWQPVLAPNGVEIKPGIEEDNVGTITRADGGKQLTLNGWPLYYYKDDLTLGQTAGYGIGNTWFAIAADGSKAKKTSTGGSTTSGSTSGATPDSTSGASGSGSSYGSDSGY